MSTLRALIFGAAGSSAEEHPPEERAFKACDCGLVVLERWVDHCATCGRSQSGVRLSPPAQLRAPGAEVSALFPFSSGGVSPSDPVPPTIVEHGLRSDRSWPSPSPKPYVPPPPAPPPLKDVHPTRVFPKKPSTGGGLRVVIELPPNEDPAKAPTLEVRVGGQVRLRVLDGRVEHVEPQQPPLDSNATRLMHRPDLWTITVPVSGDGGRS